uniref:Chemosensory protein 2 n=1 Tax=Subpsaltria yangi TaxID=1195109 RepID=A0A385IUP8_9HEMI|nr:chemosensory protein 2 [Subpsaltria yangi]
MLKKLLFICVICVSIIMCKTAIEVYSVPYLRVTYKEVVTNKRHLTQYVRCFTNKGTCPPQAIYIKRILPEIIKTNCSKCDPHLNEVFTHSMSMMKEKQPAEWSKIMEKYNDTRHD